MSELKTVIMDVSPQWAQQQLDKLSEAQTEGSWKQRAARNRAIQRYAQDMKAGKWLLTHQGIAFDNKNRLIDGQNRLWGVVKSGSTIPMMVTTGIPENGKLTVMDVIDGGSPRTLAQAFQVSHGFGGNAQEAAVLVRQIVRMVVGVAPNMQNRTCPQISTAEALFILNDLNYLAAFERFCAIVELRKIRRGPIVAPWCWYWCIKPRKAEQFARDYASLEGLAKNAPALQLYRYFTNTATTRRSAKSELEKQSVTAAAIHAFDKDESIGILQPSVKVALTWLVKENEAHVKAIVGRVT